MGDVAPSLLLFSIAGGYAALQLCHLTKHRADALEWDRNLFEATLVGAVLFVVARAMALGIEATPLNAIRDPIKRALPFGYAGSLLLTLLLGVVAGLVGRRFVSPKEAIRRAVNDHGGELRKLLADAGERRVPVLLTLTNRKVYVGLVLSWPGMSTKHQYLRILPTISGYRDASTMVVRFTTPYWRVYEELASESRDGGTTRATVSSFGIVIPLDEVTSASFFDHQTYERYFSGQEGDLSRAP